jgi:hypothetical protein
MFGIMEADGFGGDCQTLSFDRRPLTRLSVLPSEPTGADVVAAKRVAGKIAAEAKIASTLSRIQLQTMGSYAQLHKVNATHQTASQAIRAQVAKADAQFMQATSAHQLEQRGTEAYNAGFVGVMQQTAARYFG